MTTSSSIYTYGYFEIPNLCVNGKKLFIAAQGLERNYDRTLITLFPNRDRGEFCENYYPFARYGKRFRAATIKETIAVIFNIEAINDYMSASIPSSYIKVEYPSVFISAFVPAANWSSTFYSRDGYVYKTSFTPSGGTTINMVNGLAYVRTQDSGEPMNGFSICVSN